MSQTVFILGGARTPMTEFVGALKDVSAIELGAIAARGALSSAPASSPSGSTTSSSATSLQTSVDAIYGARHVGLKAGVPIEVPALTVNRLCGSGIQAVVSGAQHILLGEAGVVLAGGMENMSQAPHVIRGARAGLKLGQGKLEDSLWEGAPRSVRGLLDGASPPRTAPRSTASRARSGRLRAAQPAARRTAAWTAGVHEDESSPVEIKTRKGVDAGRPRRPHAARHDARGAGEAAAAFKKDGVGHGRQRQRHRRWRRGAGARRRGAVEGDAA